MLHLIHYQGNTPEELYHHLVIREAKGEINFYVTAAHCLSMTGNANLLDINDRQCQSIGDIKELFPTLYCDCNSVSLFSTVHCNGVNIFSTVHCNNVNYYLMFTVKELPPKEIPL